MLPSSAAVPAASRRRQHLEAVLCGVPRHHAIRAASACRLANRSARRHGCCEPVAPVGLPRAVVHTRCRLGPWTVVVAGAIGRLPRRGSHRRGHVDVVLLVPSALAASRVRRCPTPSRARVADMLGAMAATANRHGEQLGLCLYVGERRAYVCWPFFRIECQ